ncbi:hypothetical protein Dimus_013163, partial [Dionaea muscipula]
EVGEFVQEKRINACGDCKEFYKNSIVSISKKKEVERSCVRGVKIELDGMILAGILGVPGDNGICEYIKDIWEDSIYRKPLPITRKFANNNLLTVARRVMSTRDETFPKISPFHCDQECSTKIWEERYNQLHGLDIYGSFVD